MSNQLLFALDNLGWSPFFEKHFLQARQAGFDVGRISIEHRDKFQVLSEYGELIGEVTGKFLYGSDERGRFPKVGDWVVITVIPSEQKALIHEILPRRTFISRKVAGNKTEEQVMATNLDDIFIVHGLDLTLNFKKLERYLAMTINGGCRPVLILNKIDLVNMADIPVEKIKDIMGDSPVFYVSTRDGRGMEEMRSIIQKGKTFAFVGPSGVGKSSIINRLIGKELLETQEVRLKDNRGRHTTTRREIIIMPGGGILIDTPGIRELHLWDADEGMNNVFHDIQDLADQCFFSDCRHEQEKGCAVLKAVQDGIITVEHHKNYLKLQKEQDYLELKQTQQFYNDKKRKWKEINKSMRYFYKKNPKGKGR